MEVVPSQTVPWHLSAVRVRLIEPGELARWEELMRAHHYLGLTAMVGKSLRYVGEVEGQWVALLGWASAALKCAARDAWIGWSPALQWQRIGWLANNTRFLLLPGPRMPNLASKLLGANLARLSADWQAIHGRPLLLAETFVDPTRFAGTCYRAANWMDLGATRGFAKSNTTYTEHGQRKRILVYPLHREARAILAAALPHPHLPTPREVKSMQLSEPEAADLLTRLATLTDTRSRQGQRHTLRSVLAVAACAVISGARGSCAIAEWAARADTTLLRRLRCRRSPNVRGGYSPPSEPTIRRVLAALQVGELERVLADWLQAQNSASATEAVAIDGKALRGSRQDQRCVHLVSALGHDSGSVLNQVKVADKSNEIPAIKPLLDPLPLQGKVVTADALHTQVETARYLVEDKKAHYVFTVKDNQPGLKEDIATLQLNALPPSAHQHR
jgi:hypothetical protein